MRPRAWVEFFEKVRQLGQPGIFAVALPQLAFGSFVVAFHNVWAGVPIVLTIFGWMNVAKAAVYLTFPAFALRKMRPSPGGFVGAGVALLALAALIGWHLWVTR